MRLVSYEEFKQMEEYQKFIIENPSVGHLKVEAFTAYKSIPIENAEILITKDFDDFKVVFFDGYTDSSGVISNIELPAPISEANSKTYNIPKYTLYDLTAIHVGYESIKKYDIGMFGDVNILQYVKMIPQFNTDEVDSNGD